MAEDTTRVEEAVSDAERTEPAGPSDERTQAAEGKPSAAPAPDPAAEGEPSSGEAEAAPGEQRIQEHLDAAQQKAQEYLALAQRTQADFENYRKRMARESAQAVDRGVAKLARELLPALDHLDIALKAAEGHEDVVKGFAIVRDEFLAALAKAGIQAFSPKGEQFNPNEHEAMAQQPAEGAESGTVIEVYQSGYRLNGTVLRPARVVVAQ